MAGGSSAAQVVMPMLATPGPVPDTPGWAFEFTWDGVRSLAEIGPDQVRLVGGSRRAIATRYPEFDILPALIERHVLLDGKIVTLDACGRPSLSRLQHRMHLQKPSDAVLRRVPVAYYVFDLLRLDDRSTLQLPYHRRRELLDELDLPGGPLVLPPYFLDTDGHAVLETAAQYGLPGVVAKRADSTYQPGRRSRSWVQTALRRTQEVIIGGWVPGKRGPAGLGSLLVGVPTEVGLRYVGQVSMGLADAERHELQRRLADLAQPASPFADPVPPATGRTAQWVAPVLLGEVSYQRWTSRGRLGNPSWTGLRRDKHPAAVQAPVVLNSALPAAAKDPERIGERELHDTVRRARTQVQALRAQLSPHFLYNALSAVAALMRTDPPRAGELLNEFAGFTRYSLRSGVEFSTLADEVENVESYLALEQARLEERLQVTMRIDLQLLPVIVPFLSLQLVVEHAVRHGIEELPDGGTVAITAADAEADCLVTVAISGPVAPAGVGLDDLDDRLRLAYGDDYGLVLESLPDQGSTITLRVPKEHTGLYSRKVPT
jgi:DNA ligase D-like protein (predicted ligase)